MGAKKISLKGKGGYATYKAKGQYEKNRKRRLERHLKAYPEDATAQAALKAISYRRYTPKTKGGWINRKDVAYHGVPIGEAQLIARAKRVARKINNMLATDRPYQELLKQVAVAVKNKETKDALTQSKNKSKQSYNKAKQKPNAK